jgi:hypothetical protein
MAETLKQTQDKLRSRITQLINQAAKETDLVEKARLTAQAKKLNQQLKESKQSSNLEKNLSVVEKAKKELDRLNALDPNTPGLAPAKAAQQNIIDDATKKGLPKPEAKKKPEPNIIDTAASKAEAAKKKVTTPAVDDQGKLPPKKTKPGANSGVVGVGGAGGFTDSQNAARITKTGTKTATGNEDINAIYTLAKSQYGNVDSIFLYDEELKALLIEAVGDPTTTVGDMKPAEFARRLAATDWAIRNGTTYATRDAERRQYNETLDKYNKQLELADTQDKKDVILSKIGQLKTTSDYAKGLESAKAYIEAVASGLTGTMSPERLDAFVKRMYDSSNDKDPNIIKRELAALVSYKPGMQLGGAVGGDLTTLRATAAANGFNLDTSFGSSINDWLQRLAKGESIETFKNTIRGAAKLGLPDKVANLLDQGLDLKDIYDPYKKVMASVLEVAPDSISLDDKTLRMAIGPEKEMSIYDFQRTLRKDPRWQYTNNAREEGSNAVLGVLRDFGFQG